MTVGQRIRYIRKQKNITQDELAQKLGFSGKSTVSNYELDLRSIELKDVEKWASALEVDPLALLGRGEFFREQNELIAKITSDGDMLDIVKKLYKLPEDKIVLLNSLLDSWLV